MLNYSQKHLNCTMTKYHGLCVLLADNNLHWMKELSWIWWCDSAVPGPVPCRARCSHAGPGFPEGHLTPSQSRHSKLRSRCPAALPPRTRGSLKGVLHEKVMVPVLIKADLQLSHYYMAKEGRRVTKVTSSVGFKYCNSRTHFYGIQILKQQGAFLYFPQKSSPTQDKGSSWLSPGF